jgi:hypothetical protein
MRITALLTTVVTVVFLLAITNSWASGEVYRWVDEKGEVHYGDHPPEQADVETVDIPESQTTGIEPGETGAEIVSGPSAGEQARKQRKQKWDAAQASKAEMAQICEENRKIVETIEPRTRLLIKQKDGTMVQMDDNVRLETVAAAKELMAANCKD